MADGKDISLPDLFGGQITLRVPRNAPCPCASGRKAKVCHFGVQPAQELEIADARVWPILFAFALNTVRYLRQLLAAISEAGFSAQDESKRSSDIAVSYFASVGYRVGAAILTLIQLDQGEEARGLNRELTDARFSMAYYQSFADEATKLIHSRYTRELVFVERRNKRGLRPIDQDPEYLSRLKFLSAREIAQHPEIVEPNKKMSRSGFWEEPSVRSMMKRLHEVWSGNPTLVDLMAYVDENLADGAAATPQQRAESQHFVASEIPSQWLHSTFLLSERYIDWSGSSPKLRPPSTSLRESPNVFLDSVSDSVLAIANGIGRQFNCADARRVEAFGTWLTEFQRLVEEESVRVR